MTLKLKYAISILNENCTYTNLIKYKEIQFDILTRCYEKKMHPAVYVSPEAFFLRTNAQF